MDFDIPLINWFEDPAKASINSVFDGLNDFVESLDLFNKYKNTHIEQLHSIVRPVKILGMQSPFDLANLFYPTYVSTDIRRRIYKADWENADATTSPSSPAQKSTELGTKFIENNQRTVVLGGPGAGKTTFLRYLALAFSEKSVHKKAKLTTHQLPLYIHLPAIQKEKFDILSTLSLHLKSRTDERASLFVERLLGSGNAAVLLDSAPRRFVWNPTSTIVVVARALWACGQAAQRAVHMSMGRCESVGSRGWN